MKYKNKFKARNLIFGITALATSQLITPRPAYASIEDSSFVVEEIEVLGLQRMELGTFYNLLPLQVGESLSPERIPVIIRSIYGSNSFDDIRLFREGSKLIVDLNERPTISDITIDGNSDIDSEQILEAMSRSGFAKGEVFDPSAIKSIKIGIEEQYFSHGKYSIKIEDKIVKQSRNRVYVKFIIDEGEPAKIQKIGIVGNSLFTDEELLEQFELSEGGWLSTFTGDDQYSREKLSGDLETLRSFYLDRGYLTFNNASTQVSISPDRKGIYVTINIEEGEKFTVNDIVFSGDLILEKEQLQRIMPLTKGDTYSAAAISFAEEQIKENLGYYGYAFAKVVTVPEIKEGEKKVNLNVFIEPGKKVYVNRVNFSGNEATDDEVLRREIRLMEGGALSTRAVERSKLRLQRLTYMEEVEVETPKAENEDDRVDINYAVKERSAGTVSGGIGYSDRFGVSLNANVSHNNFMGSGKKVQFAINKSDYVESYNADYFDPYFTINEISAGVGVYLRKTDYGSINLYNGLLDSTGVDFKVGYRTSEVTGLNFSLGYQDNLLKAQGTQSEQVIDFFAENGRDVRAEPNFDYDIYRFSVGVSRNTLNRGVFPDRGTSQTLVLNSALPGSDLEFYKVDYNFRYYLPLAHKWTFMTSFRASYGDGYGDTTKLPYFENFTAGGSGTMRGFDTNTIGPRLIVRTPSSTGNGVVVDAQDGQAQYPLPSGYDNVTIQRRSAGGNARVLTTFELIFPTPFAEESNSVRTSFFVDVGNLWDTEFDLDDYKDIEAVNPDLFATIPDYSKPESYRMSAGFSLQWLSPMGPLTISFSKPFKQSDLDETETFSFNIGQTF
ncbi:outer membrane protein assembly factor BamA [Aliikangiella sp. G2MR2-5]|uniref:outer membrane protein assembly factor BamA n=1 Tax=Aliikangiella sp. G2MR2-5 TaxID=2788943 RepID=UPI0018A8BFAC|nr:outer membrane protein assembly factor BamA [Aliikangiella sp. G2MR2-5]